MPGSAAEAPGDWRFERQARDVELWQRAVPASAYPQLQARGRLPAAPVRVYRTISDYDRFAEFIPQVEYSHILRRQGRETWVYQRLGLPGPLADRHYVLRIEDLPGHTIRWRLAEDEPLPAAAGRVLRPAAFTGSWELVAAGNGSTEARYTVHVDPGGQLPRWLALPAMERYVIDVMAAVRARLEHGEAGP